MQVQKATSTKEAEGSKDKVKMADYRLSEKYNISQK